MPNPSSTFFNKLRQLKHDVLRQYCNFRIQGDDEPYSILWRDRPYRILLILSHMRSGSSLLSHLLISNPEIIGYGETHLQYEKEGDFKTLIAKVYERNIYNLKGANLTGLGMSHRYVLDKVLHNSKFANPSFLTSPNVYAIFLLREPQRTLPSLLDLKSHWTEKEAIEYYTERLPVLESYAKLIDDKRRSLFITYEQSLDRTSEVFAALQNLLGTRQGFSEEYEVLNTTGTKGVGDSKGNIKAGKIVRERRQINCNVSPEVVERGQQAFDRCAETLSQYCQTLPSP
ncbi:sulfotransferase family protein [Oscillatoria sp. FACHB-1406]|uniref:sulfotransferase family protein n=1 Tax=Oscillatoria sp. FACHB-1406 TaxID=2692846 RepID=UPI001684FA05|nr:sulfotransferase family protein [Oscillatoria sp. FACHB-1406]MBD2578288.1 sulfotransferase family protein [Oscillatoria sp. FACHB-1406]